MPNEKYIQKSCDGCGIIRSISRYRENNYCRSCGALRRKTSLPRSTRIEIHRLRMMGMPVKVVARKLNCSIDQVHTYTTRKIKAGLLPKRNLTKARRRYNKWQKNEQERLPLAKASLAALIAEIKAEPPPAKLFRIKPGDWLRKAS
jgi:hypothetical protein